MVKTKRAIVLLCTASESQQHQNESLISQLAVIADYAENFKIKIEKIVDNKQSCIADTPSPDGLMNEVFNWCSHHTDVDYLLVSDITRISRDYDEFIKWKTMLGKVGVKIVSAKQSQPDDETATAQLMENLMLVLGQYDSAIRSERVKRGLRNKKEIEAKN